MSQFVAVIRMTDDDETPPAYVGEDRTANSVVWDIKQAAVFTSEDVALLAAEDVMIPGEYCVVENLMEKQHGTGD